MNEKSEDFTNHEYLEFVDIGATPSGLTRRWSVRSRHGKNFLGQQIILGEVSWWSPWRQYTFKPSSNTIWNKECLRTIAGFCESITEDHRSKKSVDA